MLTDQDNIINKLLDEHPIIPNVRNEYMMSKDEVRVVLTNLKAVIDNRVEGDVVELGCNEGATSLFIKRLLIHCGNDKVFHVYDSFEGLPERTEEDKSSHPISSIFEKGLVKVPTSRLLKNFADARLDHPVVHKWRFKDIPTEEIPPKIAFAFFDGDFYESILDSFRKVYPRLTPGSRVVIDDYDWEALPGVKRACDDFLMDKPESVTVQTNQGVMIKTTHHLWTT